jgi:hypothetical protein
MELKSTTNRKNHLKRSAFVHTSMSECIKKPNRKTDEFVTTRYYLESHCHDGVHGVDVEEGQNGDRHFLRSVRVSRAEHSNA